MSVLITIVCCVAGVALGVVFARPILYWSGRAFVYFIYSPWWLLGNGGIRDGIPAVCRFYFKRWSRVEDRKPPHT